MPRLIRRRLFRLIFFVLVIAVATTQSGWLKSGVKTVAKNEPGLYSVSNFVDGDTIAVDMNGRTETVRFIGVDTPETHKPNTPVQCFGPNAAAYTKQLIGNQRVRLQADPMDTNRDRYGRLLRYIYLPDGTLVEDKLISQGYGFAYTLFPFEKKQQFVDEQDRAKQAGLGLWSACQVREENGKLQTNNL